MCSRESYHRAGGAGPRAAGFVPCPGIWTRLALPTPFSPDAPASVCPGGNPMAQPNVKAALSYLDAHLPEFQEQLVKLSRVPGVSAEPAPNPYLRRSAEATAEVMRSAGIENVQILELPGVHPYVYGDWMKKPGAPTVPLYGHHDVQP